MKNANPFLLILSVLLPLIGYILFFAKKKDDEEAAAIYLWGAIAGSVIGVILII